MSLKRIINNERFQRYFKNISTIVLSKEKSLSTKKERCGTREKEKNRAHRETLLRHRFVVVFHSTILYDESCLFISPKKNDFAHYEINASCGNLN